MGRTRDLFKKIGDTKETFHTKMGPLNFHTPWCLALGEWPPHCDYPGHYTFKFNSSVYSCHLFSISFASVRSLPFLSSIKPIFAWYVPLVSLIFLKRSLVFPILFFSSISLHWSLRKAFLYLLAYISYKWDHTNEIFVLLCLFYLIWHISMGHPY